MKMLEDKLLSIELKVRSLITARNDLEKELEALRAERRKMEALMDVKDKELEKYKQLNQFKHIATSLSDREKRQTKQKINALVGEIDRCIALLND